MLPRNLMQVEITDTTWLLAWNNRRRKERLKAKITATTEVWQRIEIPTKSCWKIHSSLLTRSTVHRETDTIEALNLRVNERKEKFGFLEGEELGGFGDLKWNYPFSFVHCTASVSSPAKSRCLIELRTSLHQSYYTTCQTTQIKRLSVVFRFFCSWISRFSLYCLNKNEITK